MRNISPLMSAIVLAGQVSRQYVNGLTPPQYGNNRASSFSSSLLSNIVDAYIHIHKRAEKGFYSHSHICTHAGMSRTYVEYLHTLCTLISHVENSSFELRKPWYRIQHAFSVPQLDSSSFGVLVFPTACTRLSYSLFGNVLSAFLSEVKVRLFAADNISAV